MKQTVQLPPPGLSCFPNKFSPVFPTAPEAKGECVEMPVASLITCGCFSWQTLDSVAYKIILDLFFSFIPFLFSPMGDKGKRYTPEHLVCKSCTPAALPSSKRSVKGESNNFAKIQKGIPPSLCVWGGRNMFFQISAAPLIKRVFRTVLLNQTSGSFSPELYFYWIHALQKHVGQNFALLL